MRTQSAARVLILVASSVALIDGSADLNILRILLIRSDYSFD